MKWLFQSALLVTFAIPMCVSCQNGANKQKAIVERVFDIRVPSDAQVQIQKHGTGSTVAVMRMSAETFAVFRGSCTNYTVWYPIQDGQVFEAAGIKFVGGTSLRGIYSVGRSRGGLVQVLIWDEQSAALLAMLSEGMM